MQFLINLFGGIMKDAIHDIGKNINEIFDSGTVANQLFRRIFCNSKFFGTHVHLGTLTFQKILNHKNFLEKLDLRQRHYKSYLEFLTNCIISFQLSQNKFLKKNAKSVLPNAKTAALYFCGNV